MDSTTKKIINDAVSKCKNLECDGTVRVISYLLSESHIKHEVYCGTVENVEKGLKIPLHFWIIIDDEIVDYKCRMWLGKDAPNGIFKQSEYPDYVYTGKIVDMKTSKLMYDILTMGV